MLCIFQNWFDDYDIFFSFFLEGEGREGRISSREALIKKYICDQKYICFAIDKFK